MVLLLSLIIALHSAAIALDQSIPETIRYSFLALQASLSSNSIRKSAGLYKLHTVRGWSEAKYKERVIAQNSNIQMKLRLIQIQ
jgi:hypothetical protein